ncbi:type IV pilus secretin family protein [Desulforegula conservatrix]|uniref:type IV pilus secretin family protein n=1 Tax=Desulforegula conservatrix TaxID=153026 RepID=UPI000683DC0C|nr:type IV pilus secretin family protein [Desulforegula conservatrix]
MSYGQMKNKNFTLVTSLVFVVLISSFFMSCSSKNTGISEDNVQSSKQSDGDEPRRISSLKIDESGSVITLQSTSRLTYSVNKKQDLHSLELYLPKTLISEEIDRNIESRGVVKNLAIEESKEDQSSMIKINANSDFEHSIVRESDNLIKINLKNKTDELKTEKVTAAPNADRLVSIKTENTGNGLRIKLVGNGKIDNYKKSVIEKPNPRIVFDIYKISSDANKEKKISVNSPYADAVRYYNYSDYVRVVIDSKANALKNFTDITTPEGLIIDIGKTGIGAASTVASTGGQSSLSKVEKIDLSSDNSGKSILQINTSSPVKYEVIPIGKKIELSIKNTSLSTEQQKPVVSNKFDSAVEKILPSQKNSDAALMVEMRNQVPYRVEQNGNIISVHFEKGTSPAVSSSQTATKSSLKIPAAVTSPAAGKVNPVKLAAPNMASVSKSSMMPKEENIGFDIGNTKKNYIGEKIALDFFETDIRNVFRIIQTVSKKNFAIDSDVKGKVTMRMDEPVPWDQVLDLVLKMNGLGMAQDADIIRIATLDRLKKEEDMKRDVLKAQTEKEYQQKALEPIFTEYITVNYSNAKNEVMPHLKSLITEKRGSISIDERNNQVIITDTKEKIAKAKDIIKSIDKVTPQVIIEARVVEATNTVSREIGTKWNAADKVGEAGDDTIFTYAMGATNLPANASGLVDLSFTRIAGNNMILNARLEAFESTGDIKIISSPKILTLDNKEAKIEQGVEYPYLKEIDENGKATYELKPLTLNLTVKPHVTPDNRIAMTIVIKKDDIGDEIVQSTSGITGNTKTFARSFLKKEATTELLVDDGETVVIGGIVKTRTEDSSQGVPYLSKIPVLGWLFKNKLSDNERSELLLFITPRIVQLEQKG